MSYTVMLETVDGRVTNLSCKDKNTANRALRLIQNNIRTGAKATYVTDNGFVVLRHVVRAAAVEDLPL